ncbi:MAG: hypothetical protein AAGC71_01645 [Pseudomonadota bacterium]
MGFFVRVVLLLVSSISLANAALRATVTVDPSLASAVVELSANDAIPTLTASSSAATALLSKLTSCDNAPAVVATTTGRRATLLADVRCVRYFTSLPELTGRRGLSDAASSVARLTDPRHWLLTGAERFADIDIDFRIPPDTVVSAPWQSRGASGFRRVGGGDRSGTPVVVFGRFAQSRLTTPLGTLRIAYLGTQDSATHNKLQQWLRASAANVATQFERLIVNDVQVLLFDAASDRVKSPVPFGMVTRTEAPAVRFYVDPQRSLADLNDDWTATHELAHLVMPRIRERWIGEGFATYLQNVLMASGGAWSEDRVWREMTAGFARGRAARPELSPAETAGQSGSRMKVYWAGAALALAADVELRARTANKRSLPAVLASYAQANDNRASASAGTFLAALDAELDAPLFVPLLEAIATEPGFPDTESILERLGVRVTGESVSYERDAELASIRPELWQRRLTGRSPQPES